MRRPVERETLDLLPAALRVLNRRLGFPFRVRLIPLADRGRRVFGSYRAFGLQGCGLEIGVARLRIRRNVRELSQFQGVDFRRRQRFEANSCYVSRQG